MTLGVAGVVLAYQPEATILSNVSRLREQVERVYIVNNSPGDERTAELLESFDDEVVVLDQPRNVGVAAGFNAGMRRALADGADYVWIFDQDSTVADGMLTQLQRAFMEHVRPVAIAGPALRAEETGFLYDADRGEGIGERSTLISSGALFSRAALERIGLHDERLFIDYVDHDISLRARAAGLSVVKVFDTVLDHRFGASTPARFLGRRVYLSNYSPMRQYYMTRNRVIMIRRYGIGRWFWEDAAYVTKAWIKVVLCERDRPRKIRAALRGAIDGIRFRSVHMIVD